MPTPLCVSAIIAGPSVLSLELAFYLHIHVVGIRHKKTAEGVLACFLAGVLSGIVHGLAPKGSTLWLLGGSRFIFCVTRNLTVPCNNEGRVAFYGEGGHHLGTDEICFDGDNIIPVYRGLNCILGCEVRRCTTK